jgi:hypothetical protein
MQYFPSFHALPKSYPEISSLKIQKGGEKLSKVFKLMPIVSLRKKAYKIKLTIVINQGAKKG